jgi:hypothetical protein
MSELGVWLELECQSQVREKYNNHDEVGGMEED